MESGRKSMSSSDVLNVLDHRNRDRLANELRAAPQTWFSKGGNSNNAAVLVPLFTSECGPSILFTLRSNQMSRHRNQVSFPGGLAEDGDRSPVATALREAEEELGISPNQVEIWGQLPRMPDRVRSTMITPVLGCLHGLDLSSLKPNSMEVSRVFHLTVQHLVNPAHRRYTCLRPWLLRMPVFLGGPCKIWGLTAMMTDLTLTHLLPNYYPISSARAKVK